MSEGRENDFQNFEIIQNENQFKLTIGKSIIVAILIIVCMQIVAGLINLPSFFKPFLYHFTLPLSYLVGGLLAIIVLLPFVKTNWKSISQQIFTKLNPWIILLSILLFATVLPLAEFLTSTVPTTGNEWLEKVYKLFSEGFEMMLNYKIAGFLTVCIIAPIFEEILFRGIILRGLLQNGISAFWSIFISAFLFGIAHMNPWQFIGAGLLGVVFGFVYERTKSLGICIFLHALNNTISFVLMLKFKNLTENVTDVTDWKSVLICTFLALLIGWAIYKLTQYKVRWN